MRLQQCLTVLKLVQNKWFEHKKEVQVGNTKSLITTLQLGFAKTNGFLGNFLRRKNDRSVG